MVLKAVNFSCYCLIRIHRKLCMYQKLVSFAWEVQWLLHWTLMAFRDPDLFKPRLGHCIICVLAQNSKLSYCFFLTGCING